MAAETIDEFAGFLRGNIDVLTGYRNILFSEELEHVKCYAAIEKKRFGKRLNFVYQIETADFFLPALTLQPIVENAVKHGVMRRIEDMCGGKMSICSIPDVGTTVKIYLPAKFYKKKTYDKKWY